MSDIFRNAGAGGSGGGAGGFGDLFGGFFRQPSGNTSARPPRSRRGADVETEVRIGFADAVTGVTVPLGITERTTCPTCHGVGARPGTSPRDCPVCKGTGLTTRNQGSFAFSEPCSNCHGTGSLIDDPCPTCNGERTVVHSRRLTTRIPAGVADGQRIKLAGKGEPGFSGGPAGDLFVVVHVSSHELFGRTGDNLTLSVPVTFPELALGTTLTVPTLSGVVSLRVPAGTSNGRKFRVKGAGVQRKDSTGDLIVTVEIAVPQRLTAKAEEALETFAKAQTADPREAITRALQARNGASGSSSTGSSSSGSSSTGAAAGSSS
jgi:molecular chaperone DnaJ